MAKLIHLTQVAGGAALRTEVTNLLASYDAYKVLTDIAKEGDAGKYNVNELLSALKTSTEGLQQDVIVGGTIDQRIDASRDLVETKITAINEAPIKDRVKVTAVVTPAGVLTFDGDIATLVPNVDNTDKYVLYTEDNRPVLDANGDALTYDFKTSSTSGIPSKVVMPTTVENKAVEYEPVTEDLNVKLFPIGTFKFGTLKSDYLLDNNELNTAIYAQAIDEIVVGLAQDQQLIDSIKALVGNETVQNQIKLITDALSTRIDLVENRVGNNETNISGLNGRLVQAEADITKVKGDFSTLNEQVYNLANTSGTLVSDVGTAKSDIATLKGDDTVVGSVAHKVKAEETARKQADTALDTRILALESSVGGNVQDAIDASVAVETTARKAADNQLQYGIDLINAVEEKEETITVETDMTHSFTLAHIPNTKKVSMFVNGLRYREDSEFTVNRTTKEVVWTATTEADGFDILTGFVVNFEYQITKSVTPPVQA